MTAEMKKALLDFKARQEAGERLPCPCCGQDGMRPDLYTNALSRQADIMICSECGQGEALLAFVGTPFPVECWAIFRPRAKP